MLYFYQWIRTHSAVIGVLIAVLGLLAAWIALFVEPTPDVVGSNTNSPSINISGGEIVFEADVVVGNNNTINNIANRIAIKLQNIQIQSIKTPSKALAESENSNQAEYISEIDKDVYSEHLAHAVAPILELKENSDDEYQPVYDAALESAIERGDVSRSVLILEEVIQYITLFDERDKRFSLANLYLGLGALSLVSDIDRSIQHYSEAVRLDSNESSIRILEKLLRYRKESEVKTIIPTDELIDFEQRSNTETQLTGVVNADSAELPSDLRELRDLFARQPSLLGRYLQVEPFQKEGALIGYRITTMEDLLTNAGLGIVAGDVIVRINDVELNSEKEATRAFTNLSKAESVYFTILRDGFELTHYIEMPK